MKKLASDFTLSKYGLHTRLVNENDAAFIVELRTDTRLGKFLHPTDHDVEKQREWIEAYKKREVDGLDYYFIHSYHGEPFSVNRIYDISEFQGTSGSWICKHGTDAERMVASCLVERDVLFDILGLPLDRFDVRKENKRVWRFHKQMGAKIVGEDGENYYLELKKEMYVIRRNMLIDLLKL